MATVVPGYDDNWRSCAQVYGDTPDWRTGVLRIARERHTAGITMDIWNGFVEGYVVVPTDQKGDESYELAKRLFWASH